MRKLLGSVQTNMASFSHSKYMQISSPMNKMSHKLSHVKNMHKPIQILGKSLLSSFSFHQHISPSINYHTNITIHMLVKTHVLPFQQLCQIRPASALASLGTGSTIADYPSLNTMTYQVQESHKGEGTRFLQTGKGV